MFQTVQDDRRAFTFFAIIAVHQVRLQSERRAMKYPVRANAESHKFYRYD